MRWLTRRRKIVLCAGLVFAGLLTYSFFGEVRRTTVLICAGCGRFHEKNYFVGIKTGDEVRESDLSIALAEKRKPDQSHNHNWKLMSSITGNAFHRLNSCMVGNGGSYQLLLVDVALRSLTNAECADMLKRIEQSQPSDHAAIRKELEKFPISTQ